MRLGSPLVAGVGVGAGVTYFLDPGRGARRRARVRDSVTHAASLTRRAVSTTSRDFVHRAYGTAASLGHVVRHGQVDDEVLVERVRAKLGRFVSHPHAVRVTASSGNIALMGPILRREAHRLVRVVRHVRGVRDVIDNLERHDRATNVPALQGGRAPAGDRLDVLQAHWAPATRVLVGTIGAALTIGGLMRRDLRGVAAAVVGAGLIARAATNLPVNRFSARHQ